MIKKNEIYRSTFGKDFPRVSYCSVFLKIYSINVNFQFTKRHIKNLFQYPSSTFKTDDMKTHLYK